MNHVDPNIRVVSRVFPVDMQQIKDADQRNVLLDKNPNRVGFIIYNASSNSVLINFGPEAAKMFQFTTQIGNETEYNYLPTVHPYRGIVTYNPQVPGNGYLMVTELQIETQRR
ncbi:MAG: hypothetical protein AAFW89_12995 [Bacteroidota bacterium]